MFETPMPKVGNEYCFNKNFKMKTIKLPAKPPANKEKPKNNITLAAQALGLPPPLKNDELLASVNKLDFSMEFTINIPKVEHIKGIQSTNVTWAIEAFTVLEYIAASTIDQNPMAYNAPAK
jgi:hypothetical protein